MTTNEFREFQFYDNINPEILEYIFESAWNTLTKLYPNIKLDSSDCFNIYVIPNTIEDDNAFNNDLVYVTGLFNGKPALQNLGTKEIIQIKMNRERWY